MRRALLLLLVTLPAAAKGLPPPSRIDVWKSINNQQRLRMEWDGLPDATPIKLPDGSTEPARAPWPFLLHIVEEDSPGNDKIKRNIFVDTRFALLTRAVKPVKISPVKAAELQYMFSVKVKDPCIVVFKRDFSVVGALSTKKDFTADRCLKLMVKAGDDAYVESVGKYVSQYVKILAQEEKLWKQEAKIEDLTDRAAKKSPADMKKILKEVEQLDKQLEADRETLSEKEQELKDSLRIKPDEEEALPTTVGKGRKKRKVTPEEKEAIKAYREFGRDKNPFVRAAAVEDLGTLDSPVIVDVILKGANDTDPRVVTAAGKALSRMKSAESLEANVGGLVSGNERAKTACAVALTEIKHPAAVTGLMALASSGNDALRGAVYEALGKQGDKAAVALLARGMSDRVPALRVVAATALGEIRSPEGAEPLLQALDSPDWSLQKASIEALGKVRVKKSIEPLLVLFEKQEGLLKEVLYKSLVSITGQDYKYRETHWRSWWDKYGKGFTLPTERDLEKQRLLAEKALEGYAKARKYHKIVTLSRKMVFVIDISASMKDKIVIPPSAPESVREEFPDRVKMEIAKKEMIELIATLDKHVWFNIITFAGKVKPWKGDLVRATGGSRNGAIKFVSKLKPLEASGGGRKRSGGDVQKTNTYAAMMAAFGLADQKIPDWKARSRVDTIFLVTDGVPTSGEITETPKLIAALTELNRTRGIVIHVICFDKETGKQMSRLATLNGGKYVLRGF
ncbi:MAG: HEAT repeat domain-containing protein [Planctomycetota bacterium]|nr:HEAT repeat domain-containing protein [Planctomycetota bacterium]